MSRNAQISQLLSKHFNRFNREIIRGKAQSDAVSTLEERYRSGGVGYGEVKKELVELIWDYFAPYREKRNELISDKAAVRKILLEGAEKARYHANRTICKVRKKVGAVYFKDK